MRASIEAYHGQQWVHDPQRPAAADGDRLDTLSARTLLLTGGRDTADFRTIGDAIAQEAPCVTRIDHPGAGHMLNLEMPEVIAAEIAAFLRA